MGDHVCSAPSGYDGGCLRLVRMWDDDFKREFGVCLGMSLGVPHVSPWFSQQIDVVWIGLAWWVAKNSSGWLCSVLLL